MNHVFTLGQIEALAKFAADNGRNWKSRVRAEWERSYCNSEMLQLRNASGFGPRGLRSITVTDILAIRDICRFKASEELRLQNLFGLPLDTA